MRFLFLRTGKAKQVFKELALAAVRDRLLEMRYGKRLVVKDIYRN